jgi:predicted nucleotidyltransferase
MVIDQRLLAELNCQPYPLLFVTISGAHLYGFPSPDSDYDLRGIHILPVSEVVELNLGYETIEVSELNESFKLPYIPDLIAQKLAGAEKSILEDTNVTFHQKEYDGLRQELEAVSQASILPEAPSSKNPLNHLLVDFGGS